MEDKRLSIELASLRQALWEDDVLSHEAFAPYGDILRWIATHMQLADCLTKSMKPDLLNETIRTNMVTVAENRPELPATTNGTTTTGVEYARTAPTVAIPRHSSKDHIKLDEQAQSGSIAVSHHHVSYVA